MGELNSISVWVSSSYSCPQERTRIETTVAIQFSKRALINTELNLNPHKNENLNAINEEAIKKSWLSRDINC